MNNDTYRQIKRDFDLKRQRAIDVSNRKKDEIFLKYPKLKDIKDEINKLALETTRSIINSDNLTREIEQDNMSFKLNKLQNKYENELDKLDIKKEMLEPNFECKICNDTGLVQTPNGVKYCNCFTQAVINTTYKQSNINKINEENFNTFDTCYYSNQSNKEKYGIVRSPLENIEAIKKVALEFAKKIDDSEQKNLLFIGNTGLGKTFLANCIAAEAIKNGKTVVYQTAPILMDQVMEYKFSYDKKGIEKDQYNKIFEVDLLIIDDLGTETMNNNKFTELFNIINTRLLNNKKIIISTNLSLNNLKENYEERVMSRLIGNFTICKFIGEDIRLKKKKI